MSTIADHGYVPEEHAPDPVHGHGDPTPPGKIAIWLFLASEVMFFVGLLGTYIILRSANPKLFADHAHVLSQKLAGANTLVLIFSSLTMALAVDAAQKGLRMKTAGMLLITLCCAGTFMVIKGIEYNDKYHHYTIVASSGGTAIYAYDGHKVAEDDETITLHGYRMEVTTPAFDAHLISEREMKTMSADGAEAKEYEIPKKSISTRMWYGPWKNNFFAAYFVLTGVHGIHVLCGMIPIFILMVQSLRGRVMGPAVEYTGLYWHLVDLIWIFLFPLLYLI